MRSTRPRTWLKIIAWVLDRDIKAGINILTCGLGTTGHVETFALDVNNASGDSSSTFVGANLRGQDGSLREESQRSSDPESVKIRILFLVHRSRYCKSGNAL